MRHKNWKTYLKIACSWLLIFSICFMNLETVSASEDETSVVTEQEETQDTEAFTSETDAQQTETEQTSEQFTSETETETSAETEEQIPDSIEVEKLEKEIQEATSNGQVPTTKLVEYVDESGNAIEGAPETIELGKISDHSELNISDKDYEFKSAKVNDADCSFIGVYKDTVYWSSDNINANKFADGQKLTMPKLSFLRYSCTKPIKVSRLSILAISFSSSHKFLLKTYFPFLNYLPFLSIPSALPLL